MKAILMATVMLANSVWVPNATLDVTLDPTSDAIALLLLPPVEPSPLPATTTEQPWHAWGHWRVPAAVGGVEVNLSDPIPTGKVLVIEHVSARISVNGTVDLSAVRVLTTQGVDDSLPCMRIGQNNSIGVGYFSCSTQTKIYVPAGERPGLATSVATPPANVTGWDWVVFASGHYENLSSPK
jgi:hypothetical protein